MRSIIKFILKFLARATLRKYHPRVVGITGSVGKTSTKEAVAAVLKTRFTVRESTKNYNNEIGVPLCIIGADDSGYRNFFAWLGIFYRAIKNIFIKNPHYPQILVLEMGVDHVGDMDYLLSIVRPDVAVITAVSPVHLEYLGSVDVVVQEKSKLAKAVGQHGLVVLNHADEKLRKLGSKLNVSVIFFGFDSQAQVWADGITVSRDNADNVQGLSFKLHLGGSTTPLLLPSILGKHQINVALAAAAVGQGMGVNSVAVSSVLRNFVFPPGRMKLLPGIKNTWLIDDSYNSSPLAAAEALKALAAWPFTSAGRRWAVLGDMLELGIDSEGLHRQIGEELFNLSIDYLVTVGERSRDIGRGAGAAGFDPDHYLHVSRAEEAANYLRNKISEHDIILVKGSQGVRLERAVKMLMAEPERAEELLVRQGKPWI